MRENNGKNTAGPNEFTDFEQFGLEHPDSIKTIVATNWANHPGDGTCGTLRMAERGGAKHSRNEISKNLKFHEFQI